MHTTTFAEMFPLDGDTNIIDTPGVREFGVLDFQPEEISHYFIEMRKALVGCKFNNCTHQNEPECAVKLAVVDGTISEERYGNYLNIVEDVRLTYKNY
jgi:ribosome biogenesis GTPase